MTKKYSAHLKLPFECNFEDAARQTVLSNAKFQQTVLSNPKFKPEGHFQDFFDRAILDSQFTEWLKIKGLRVTSAQVFYCPSQTMIPLHIDAGWDEVIKLNWQFGGRANMMWWKQKPNVTLPSVQHTRCGSLYLPLNSKDFSFVESTKLQSPTLVAASIPHSVLNNTDEECFILALAINNASLNLTWEEIPDFFREELL